MADEETLELSGNQTEELTAAFSQPMTSRVRIVELAEEEAELMDPELNDILAGFLEAPLSDRPDSGLGLDEETQQLRQIEREQNA